MTRHLPPENEPRQIVTAPRAIAAVATAFLTVGMVWLLPSDGYTVFRLAFVLVSVAIGWIGLVGTVAGRPEVPLGAALALLLLGFWQAVLWVFMLPAALGLAVAGVVLAHRS